MIGELFANFAVDHAFVAHKHAGTICVRDDKWPHGFGRDIGDMKGRDTAAAFNEREDGFLPSRFSVSAFFGFSTNVAFVNLDNFVCAAETACCRMAHIAHAFAKAVAHKPCRLICESKHAMDLVSANPFLAGHHKMHGKQPFVQRNFAALHCGSNGYAKGLFAFVALIDAGARAVARKFSDTTGVGISAMTAHRTVRPMELFEMLAGLIRIGENGVCKIAHRISFRVRKSYALFSSTSTR